MTFNLFKSIRYKLVFYFIALSMIPFSYIGYEGIRSAEESLKSNVLQEIFIDAYSRGKDIENLIETSRTDLLYLRGLPSLGYFLDADEMRDKPFKRYWKTLLEKGFFNFLSQKQDFSRIAYLDETGNEVIVTLFEANQKIILPKSKLYNQKENRYFQLGLHLKKGEIGIIPLRNFVEEGRDLSKAPLLRLTTPLHDANGKFKGIIYFDITGRPFFETMMRGAGNRPSRAFLVDFEGNFIFRPQEEKSAGILESDSPPLPSKVSIREMYPREVVSKILSGESGIIEDQDNFFYAYAPIFFNSEKSGLFAYVVVYPYPKSEVYAGVRIFEKFFMAAGVAVVLITLIMGIWVSGKLTKPLSMLKNGVQRFGKGDLTHRLDIKSGDEIEAVARECNRMAESLKEYGDSLERKIEERTKDIKKIQKELFHSEKMGALGVLTSGVAHEINNPMGIIINRIECMKLENSGNNLPDQLMKDLDTIRHHAVRVSNMAGNLLAISRKTSQEFSEQDIHQILERVLMLTETHLAKKNITFIKKFSSGLPKIRGNSGGLEQVFLNLISNAADAISDKGGKITIRSRYNREKRSVQLSFQDTGPGIPKEYREKIFDPFFTTKEAGKGSGLGLYISYSIIEEHEGAIEAENNDGKGGLFTVSLPKAE